MEIINYSIDWKMKINQTNNDTIFHKKYANFNIYMNNLQELLTSK